MYNSQYPSRSGKKKLLQSFLNINTDYNCNILNNINGCYPKIGNNQNQRLLKINLQDMNGCTPFYCACSHYKTEIVKLFLKTPNLNVNLGNKFGWSPLICCCFFEFAGILKVILKDLRFDLQLKTSRSCFGIIPGSTALDVAKVKDNPEIIDLLEEEIRKRDKGN